MEHSIIDKRIMSAKIYMANNGFAELLSNSRVLNDGLKIAAGKIDSPNPDAKLPKHMNFIKKR